MDLKEAVHLSNLVARSKWFVLFACFLIISFSGATYIFGLYSPAIKSALNYDQQTLDTLGFFKDLGANMGIVAGLLNEVTPPWVVLGVGAVMNLTGYLLLWLSVTGKMAKPKIWQVYLYITIGANSQAFTNTGALITCVKNFPQSRGIVLGLLKGFAGLSGAVFTQIYHALYGNNPSSLILLIGWLPCLVCLMFMFIVRPMEIPTDKKEEGRFYVFLYIALGLAGFLMIVIIVENRVNFPPIGFKFVAAVVALFLLAPLLVVSKAEYEKIKEAKYLHSNSMQTDMFTEGNPDKIKQFSDNRPNNYEGRGDQELELVESGKFKQDEILLQQLEHEPAIAIVTSGEENNAETMKEKREPNAMDSIAEKPCEVKIAKDSQDHDALFTANHVGDIPNKVSEENMSKRVFFRLPKGPNRGDDFSIPQALLSLDMWILFIATICGIGSALTAIDNMGQIGNALGFSPIDISTFVSLISIWNFLGRVVSGFSSEIFLQKYNFPRPALLSFVLAVSCVGHLFIAFAVPGSLYMASVILGFCFGAQWPLIFAMISELFGLKHYSTLYNLAGSASPLGSYLFSVRVAGYLYDKEARNQNEHLSILSKAMGSPSAAHAPAPHHSGLMCTGVRCFRLTFIIMTLVSLFGSVITGFLVVRTKDFYRGDLYAKYQSQHKDKDKHDEELQSPSK
eukprot:Gb_01156 [translate_table: standard]